MTYKPRGASARQSYTATVTEEGAIVVDGRSYSAPSYAALYCIQKSGSTRNTVNGWTSWKTVNDKWLADLRTEYLNASGRQTDPQGSV